MLTTNIPLLDKHLNTLTYSERIAFIDSIKSILEIEKKVLVVPPPTDDNKRKDKENKRYERENLNRFKLFQKNNYFTYMMSKKICEEIICSSPNNIIYGGYLRDNLIHDAMADKFYECYDTFEEYNNPTIDKSTLLRTLVPQDIDVIFDTISNYDNFVCHVTTMGFTVSPYNKPYHEVEYKTSEEAPLSPENRFKIKIKNNQPIQYLNNNKFLSVDFVNTEIIIDVTICRYYDIKPDFLCNSLMVSSSGFIKYGRNDFIFDSTQTLIERKKKELEDILVIELQILKMEAVIVPTNCCKIKVPDLHRLKKMVKKGWRIIYNNNRSHHLHQLINHCEDCCVICRDKFAEITSVPGVHTLLNGFKFGCCSASYHPKCMLEVIESSPNMFISSFTFIDFYRCVQCSQKAIIDVLKEDFVKLCQRLEESWSLVTPLEEIS